MSNEILTGIEDIERLDRNCGVCGVELNDSNRSGWDCFVADGAISIEMCIDCEKDYSKSGKKE